MRLNRPRHLGLAGGLAVVLLGAPAGAGVAAYRQDVASRDVLPPGARVGGIDVAGLTRDIAVGAVRAHYEQGLTLPVTLRVGERDFTVTPRELGMDYQVEAAVDRAFAQARDGTWLTRAWHKVRHRAVGPDVPVAAVEPLDTVLTSYVEGIAGQVGVPARDASVREVRGFLSFAKASSGLSLDTAAALAALRRALHDGTPQEVPLASAAPKVTDAAYETVLLVRTGENKIYLYKNGRVERTYGVATGSPRYPTPLGRFKVELKRYRPTWVNPWSKWSMHEPARIPPGPRNPLGTRAMNLSAPGIRIHGTPAAKSIGYSVSHGCIRMRMPDVEALYDLVPTGTTVFIVYGGPPRFMGSAAPAPNPADAADGG